MGSPTSAATSGLRTTLQSLDMTAKDFANTQERTAVWVLFLIRVPSCEDQAAGVLLLDPDDDTLHLKLTSEAPGIDADILGIWPYMVKDLRTTAETIGGRKTLNWLENHSNVFRVSVRRQIKTRNALASVDELFERHVSRAVARDSPVRPATNFRSISVYVPIALAKSDLR